MKTQWSHKYSRLSFINDLELCAARNHKLKALLHIWGTSSNDINMYFEINKRKTYQMENRKSQDMKGHELNAKNEAKP
jgi:hypothetical protein